MKIYIHAVLPLSIGLLLMLMQGCNTIKKDPLNETLITDEQEDLIEEDYIEESPPVEVTPPSEDRFVVTEKEDQSKYTGNIENNALLNRIRALLNQGRYKEVLRLTGGNDNITVIYYRGIAFYCLMFSERDAMSERVRYRDEAIRLLLRVGREAANDYYKAKGFLWHAMAVHLNYTSLQKKRVALNSLLYIQRSLKDTSSYDDSLLYMGDIYMAMGYYPQSIATYKRLAKEPTDRLVYDAIRKQFSSPQAAANHGIDRVVTKTNPNR